MPEGGAAARGLLMGKGPVTSGALMPEGGAAAGGAAAGPPTGWGPGMWTGAGTPGAAARLIGLNVDCLRGAISGLSSNHFFCLLPSFIIQLKLPDLFFTGFLIGLIPGNAPGCLWFGSFDSSWLSFRYLALAS
jgi:hypothetical protein